LGDEINNSAPEENTVEKGCEFGFLIIEKWDKLFNVSQNLIDAKRRIGIGGSSFVLYTCDPFRIG